MGSQGSLSGASSKSGCSNSSEMMPAQAPLDQSSDRLDGDVSVTEISSNGGYAGAAMRARGGDVSEGVTNDQPHSSPGNAANSPTAQLRWLQNMEAMAGDPDDIATGIGDTDRTAMGLTSSKTDSHDPDSPHNTQPDTVDELVLVRPDSEWRSKALIRQLHAILREEQALRVMKRTRLAGALPVWRTRLLWHSSDREALCYAQPVTRLRNLLGSGTPASQRFIKLDTIREARQLDGLQLQLSCTDREYVLRVPNLELCSQLVTLLQQLVDRTQPLEQDIAPAPEGSSPLQQSGELDVPGEIEASQQPEEQNDSGAMVAAADPELDARTAQEELEKTMMQVRMQAADASALASKMQAALEESQMLSREGGPLAEEASRAVTEAKAAAEALWASANQAGEKVIAALTKANDSERAPSGGAPFGMEGHAFAVTGSSGSTASSSRRLMKKSRPFWEIEQERREGRLTHAEEPEQPPLAGENTSGSKTLNSSRETDPTLTNEAAASQPNLASSQPSDAVDPTQLPSGALTPERAPTATLAPTSTSLPASNSNPSSSQPPLLPPSQPSTPRPSQQSSTEVAQTPGEDGLAGDTARSSTSKASRRSVKDIANDFDPPLRPTAASSAGRKGFF